jgi:putative transposase
MPNYRRPFFPGGMFFFTLVTERRQYLFSNARARRYLRNAISAEQAEHPFELKAIVLLPEHLHCIWQLPERDGDFSRRWSRIKRRFTKLWIGADGGEVTVSQARQRHRECGVWQKRFWDHCIRSEEDMIHHVNYIHYNPIKHGLVHCPHAWPYSSFHRWVAEGYYREDWLCDCAGEQTTVPEFAQITVAGE